MALTVHSGTAGFELDYTVETRLFAVDDETAASLRVGQIFNANGDGWQVVSIHGREVRATPAFPYGRRPVRESRPSLRQMLAATQLLGPPQDTPAPSWPPAPPADTPPPLPPLEIPDRVDLLWREIAAGRKINFVTHQTADEEAAWQAAKEVVMAMPLATADVGYSHQLVRDFRERRWFEFWKGGQA